MTTLDRPRVDPTRSLGELVAERPARARVLEAAGIDYCCHGQRSLVDAAQSAGLDVEEIVGRLDAVMAPGDGVADALPPAELADHIEATHHAYLHEELPALEALATKVAGVHGARHPELAEVERLVATVRAELEPHLASEEELLFPAAHHLDDGPAPALSERIAVLRREHESTGELLARLRESTRGYAVPDDACASYTALYERLAALEQDTFRHIHLENNVLFPAVERAVS